MLKCDVNADHWASIRRPAKTRRGGPGLRPDTQWPLLGSNLSFAANRIREFLESEGICVSKDGG